MMTNPHHKANLIATPKHKARMLVYIVALRYTIFRSENKSQKKTEHVKCKVSCAIPPVFGGISNVSRAIRTLFGGAGVV